MDENGIHNGECAPCLDNCDECYANHKFCEKCSYSYGFIIDENNENTGLCGPCPNNCINCMCNNTNCETCDEKNGFVIDETRFIQF